MKTYQTIAFLFADIIACTSAFSTPSPKTSFKPAAVVPTVEVEAQVEAQNKNAAAIAAFATAMAPFAAHATEVDEATVIGYGAGLVACVVSLAVGFSIGYGTLVKP